MSRTSKALKRLGVAGIAVATIGAGVPALVGAAAQAATPGPTTQLVIAPQSQSGAAGDCLIYSITPKDSNGGTPSDTSNQQINLQAAENPASDQQQLSFCSPTPPHGNVGTQSSLVDPAGGSTPAVATATPGPATASTQFNAAGVQYFGLRGRVPGGANITAFVVAAGTAPAPFNPITNTGATGTASATFTPGGYTPGDGPLTDDRTYGGAPAQDAVKTVTAVAADPTANPVAAGGTQYVTVQVKNTAGDPVAGVQVNARFESGSANTNTTATGTTPTSFTCVGGQSTTTGGVTTGPAAPVGGYTVSTSTATSGSAGGPVTNNQGYATCSYTANQAGSDTIRVYVNQTCGTSTAFDACEPSATFTRTTTAAPNTTPTEARHIALTASPTNATSGSTSTLTATVTDDKGTPVQGARVYFQIRGTVGTFSGTAGATCQGGSTGPQFNFRANDSFVACTNAQGIATAPLTTQASESGTVVVDATISNFGGSQCGSAAGTPAGTTTNGNCTATTSVTFGAASPSPSATPTSTTSPAPGCTTAQQNLPVRVNTPTINATGLASVTITGAPANSTIEVQGYSQNHYGTANFTNDPTPIDRVVTADSNGAATISDLRPASNTRLRARVRGCQFGANALGSVINVRAQETLQVSRVGTRRYTISGKSIPARPGGLIINIYCDKCSPQLIAQPRAGATNGLYSYTVTFPASLANQRVNLQARTGQDAQNAPGASNIRNLLVY